MSDSDIIYCNDINPLIEHVHKNVRLICPKTFLTHEDNVITRKHSKELQLLPVDVDEETHTVIKNIDIHAYSNKFDSISYKIITGKFVVSYIAKARYSKAFIDTFKDSNILILTMAVANGDTNSSYLDIEELTELIKEINPELVILTGFSSKILASDPLDLSRKIKIALQSNKSIRTQILPAKESMIINPDSYNIRLKQHRLKGFIDG